MSEDWSGQKYFFLRIDEFDRKSGALEYWWATCLVCGKRKSMVVQWIANGRNKTCGCRKAYEFPELKVWSSMLRRCENPRCGSYPHYGGRGISVCERWHDFAAFATDMGPRPSDGHSIDRIDVDGNYCPENCRWATFQEQMSNRTNSSYATHGGEKKTLSEWSVITGIPRKTIFKRIHILGWSIDDALTLGKYGHAKDEEE